MTYPRSYLINTSNIIIHYVLVHITKMHGQYCFKKVIIIIIIIILVIIIIIIINDKAVRIISKQYKSFHIFIVGI